MNFDPQQHKYTTHPSMTVTYCAICGRPESEHAPVLTEVDPAPPLTHKDVLPGNAA